MSTDASSSSSSLDNGKTIENVHQVPESSDSSNMLYSDPVYTQYQFIKESRYRDRLRYFFKALQRQSSNAAYYGFQKRYIWFYKYLASLESKCAILKSFVNVFHSGDSTAAVVCLAELCTDEDNSPLFKQFFDAEMDLLIYM